MENKILTKVPTKRRRKKNRITFSKVFKVLSFVALLFFIVWSIFTMGRIYQYTVDSPTYIGTPQ